MAKFKCVDFTKKYVYPSSHRFRYPITVHVFFDDAFEWSDHSDEDRQVNRFVTTLVKVRSKKSYNGLLSICIDAVR